jgi:negative regulator of sigma E activity
MKQDDLNELLSAYLDGESEDPDAVERLLESEPDVRRHFEVLKSHSEALRALPRPEVSPAFATRVLAGVREARVKQHRGWMPLVLPAAAVAAVVVVLGAVYFATQSPVEPATPPMANDIRSLHEMDPQTLDALLEEQFAAYPGMMDELEEGEQTMLDDPWDIATLFALEEMADIISEDMELDMLIDELTADEKAVFRELLIQYAMEG